LGVQSALGRTVLGLDNDAPSLRERPPGLTVVQADIRTLPFRDESLAGGYAWYSTLFVFADDPVHQRLLRELRRTVQRGGRFIFQSVPYERLATSPRAQFQKTLPDGSELSESSEFNPSTGLDTGTRTLRLPDGRVLSGTYRIRYHPLKDLVAMFEAAGFRFLWAHGGLDGRPLESDSHDLILGVDVPHA
jgi:SAM-dependent methyltransferase